MTNTPKKREKMRLEDPSVYDVFRHPDFSSGNGILTTFLLC
jgi:hypothetical protein